MVGGEIFVTSESNQVVAIGPESEMAATFVPSNQHDYVCGQLTGEDGTPQVTSEGEPLYQCTGTAPDMKVALQGGYECKPISGQGDQPSPGLMCSARRFGTAADFQWPPMRIPEVEIVAGKDYGDEPVADAPARGNAISVGNGIYDIPVVTDDKGHRQVDAHQLWGVLNQQAWFKALDGSSQVREAGKIGAALNSGIVDAYNYVPLDLSHVSAPDAGAANKGKVTLDEIQITVDVDRAVAKNDGSKSPHRRPTAHSPHTSAGRRHASSSGQYGGGKAVGID